MHTGKRLLGYIFLNIWPKLPYKHTFQYFCSQNLYTEAVLNFSNCWHIWQWKFLMKAEQFKCILEQFTLHQMVLYNPYAWPWYLSKSSKLSNPLASWGTGHVWKISRFGLRQINLQPLHRKCCFHPLPLMVLKLICKLTTLWHTCSDALTAP